VLSGDLLGVGQTVVLTFLTPLWMAGVEKPASTTAKKNDKGDLPVQTEQVVLCTWPIALTNAPGEGRWCSAHGLLFQVRF
jgi:hypothetical protein